MIDGRRRMQSMDCQPFDELNDVRRRRLDELFADVPYLSPTMKASRLHERFTPPDEPEMTHIAVRRDDARGLDDARLSSPFLDPEEPAPSRRWHPALKLVSAAPHAESPELVHLEILLDTSIEPPVVRSVHSAEVGPDVLRLKEAARYLRVGVGRVRAWVREGVLPCVRIGRQYRFRRAALAAFLASMD
jgi:excisionase family DNA binding protein